MTTENQVVSEADEFLSAFNEAASDVTVNEQAAEPKVEPTPKVEPVVEVPKVEPVVEVPKVEPVVEATPAPKAEPAPKEEPAAVVEEPKFDAYQYSAEEQAAIDRYRTDYPEAAGALDILTKALTHNAEMQVRKNVYDASKRTFEHMTPLAAAVHRAEVREHGVAIRTAHADFDEIMKDDGKGNTPLLAWINTQPPIFKEPLMSVYTSGTTDKVIDLVSAYKKANPTAPVEPQTPPAVPAVPVKAATPPKSDKAAALAPVKATRTAVETAGVDPNDFDAAFAIASAELAAAK